MSAIIPLFISADRLNWLIALPSAESVCYVCSSTKLRNAINSRFQEEGNTDSEALHYKEVARTMIQAIRQATGKNLKSIKFTDGTGKYLKISETSAEHNFEPTPVEAPDTKSGMSEKQAEIMSRLLKLSE